MSKFPKVRISDDVAAQEQLLREHFGIETLALVVGGSMGAQQAYEWAVRFPDKVLRAAPIAGTARNTPHNCLFTETLNEAIWSDPGWSNGEYKSQTDVVADLTRQQMVSGSELRVVEDVMGHLGLFAVSPTYMPQIDQHLGELLATEI